ncbi:hypothetical protein AAIH51_35965, partial [Pseudomonas aeruginosa]
TNVVFTSPKIDFSGPAGLELLAALRTQGVVLGTLERDWAGG